MKPASNRLMFWHVALGAALALGTFPASSAEDNAARALKAKETTDRLRRERDVMSSSGKQPEQPWMVLLDDKDTQRPEIEARKPADSTSRKWELGAEEQRQHTEAWQNALREQQKLRKDKQRQQLDAVQRRQLEKTRQAHPQAGQGQDKPAQP